MSKKNLSFPKISQKLSIATVSLLAMGTCLTAQMNGAVAQESPDPLDASNERTSDPFSGGDSNQYSPFFNMIHRMQLGNIRSVSEFDQDQQQNIGSAAEDFRTRQREMLQQPTQPNPAAPVTPNPTSVPVLVDNTNL